MDENQHYALCNALFMLGDLEIDTEAGSVALINSGRFFRAEKA